MKDIRIVEGDKLAVNDNDTLVSWLSRTADKYPKKIALVDEETELTYRELDCLSNSVAGYLLKTLQTHRLKRVGICEENTVNRVILILGILKAGGAYVPLDPSYPKSRLDSIANTSELEALISAKKYSGLFYDNNIKFCTEELIKEAKANKISQPNIEISPLDPVHILFTSGSTGKPKGVVGSHRAIINRFTWTINEFPINEGSAFCHKTSLNFIPSVWEIFGPLVCGGKLVLIKEENVKDIQKFVSTLSKYKINRIILVPSLLEQLLNYMRVESIDLSFLKLWMTSGERLSQQLVNRFFDKFPSSELVNIYGSTEIEDGCFFRIKKETPDSIFVPIGKPIANSKILFLKDDGSVAQEGEIGEICFAGPGVAQLYLDGSCLRDKTIQFSEKMDIYFKMGDYGRILPCGNIEYLGRKDHQVKIRGQRVELGEVEIIIQQSSLVEKAAAIFNEKSKSLICYIIPANKNSFSLMDLKNELYSKLPSFMVPVKFILSDTLPLTPNGKLDRLSLPQVEVYERQLKSKLVPPRTDLEKKVVEYFKELLNIDHIGVEDSFFELGGDSLKFTQLLILMREKYGVTFSLKDFYHKPTPFAVAKYIQKNQCVAKNTSSHHLTIDSGEDIKLSFLQKRLWLQQEILDEESAVFNLASLIELPSKYTNEILFDSVNFLLDRHYILKTKLNLKEEESTLRLSESNVLDRDIKNFLSQQEVDTYLEKFSHIPINIGHGLTEIQIIRTRAENKLFLLLKVHHLIFDGWSLNVFLNDLINIIKAKQLSRDPILNKPFNAYNALAKDSLTPKTTRKLESFWKSYLSGYSGIVNLPINRPRSPLKIQKIAKRDIITLSNELVANVKNLANKLGVTTYTVYLTVYYILLTKYTHQNDIVIGMPIAVREHSELSNAIGFFVNTLPIRIRQNCHEKVIDLIHAITNNVLSVTDHKLLSFDQIANIAKVPRELGYHPIYQTMFTYQSMNFPEEIDQGEPIKWKEIGNGVTDVDLTLIIQPQQDNQREIIAEYDATLFKQKTIQSFLEHYINILQAIVINPQQTLEQIDYISINDKNLMLNILNQTQKPYPKGLTLYNIFEEKVEKYSNKVAVETDSILLTYKELSQKVDNLSKYLTTQGIQPQDYVGLSVERSALLIIGMLAIWKIGAIYLPVSPDLPSDRIKYILEDTQAKYVLTDKRAVEVFQSLELPDVKYIAIEESDSVQDGIVEPAKPNSVAYVMYTSGSTGEPKGVPISHANIVDRMFCFLDFYQVKPTCRHLQYGSYSFDTSLEELLLPILSGGTLIFAPLTLTYDPKEFIELISQYNITTINFIPSLHRVFLDYVEIHGSSGLETLKYVISGAERLTTDIVRKFYKLFPNKMLFNSYGPTENTINSTLHVCTKEDGEGVTVPIGKCIANSSCYVLDNQLNLVPFGVAGRLFVGGMGLSAGYLNKHSLTRKKFIQNPYKLEEAIYDTGDTVRMSHDGIIEFLGRNDNQVKIRGYRVELGEVESAVKSCPGVSHAAIVTKTDQSGELYLAAYITSNKYEAHSISPQSVRTALAEKIPSYMSPRAIIFLDNFPYLPSGKIDFKSLLEIEQQDIELHKLFDKNSCSTSEFIIYKIWERLLGTTGFTCDTNFFSLGGSSILAIQMVNELRKTISKDISLRDFYSTPTVSAIASTLNAATIKKKTTADRKYSRTEEMPLSFSQERLWFLDQFNQDSTENIIPVILEVKGQLNIEKLQAAFLHVYKENEALTLNFDQHTGVPYQFKSLKSPFFATFTTKQPELIIQEYLQKPFHLKSDTLIRFVIIKISKNKHILLITLHHIISDGWSCAIFLRKLSEAYHAQLTNICLTQKSKEAMDFLDYVQAERANENKLNILADYWYNIFSEPATLLQLPIDKPRPTKQTFQGDAVIVSYENERFKRLNVFAREHEASLFQVLLSAYFIFLRLYSNQEDIIVGTVLANRSNTFYEEIIGYFANTLPIRAKINNESSFLDILMLIKEHLIQMANYHDTPFEKLVETFVKERDTSRSPVFQTMFVMQNTFSESFKVYGVQVEQVKAPHFRSKFDLSVLASSDEKKAHFAFEFNTSLFHRETIERFAQTFVWILDVCTYCSDVPISSLELVSPSDKKQLQSFNNTNKIFPNAHKLLDELSYDNFERYKDKIAVIAKDKSFTYKEVDELSNKLAHKLIASGATNNQLIAVIMEKGWEQVIAVYAILKAGAAYLPVNAHDPDIRILEILNSGMCHIILTQDNFEVKLNDISKCEVINVSDIAAYSSMTSQRPEILRSSDDLAYVIFTSGSTGKPKGVIIKHHAVVNTILDINDTFNVSSKDVIYGLSALNFDLSVYDIFGTLAAGATLILPAETERRNPQKWLFDIQKYSVSLWNSVPALMQMFCDYILLNSYQREYLSLNNILLSGDWIPLDLSQKIAQCLGENIKLTSLGGATEASIWSIAFPVKKIEPHWTSIPYGQPLRNQCFYVLNESLQNVPIGAPGELYIGGVGLADGYWNDKEKTDASFIQHPANGLKLYKTGDLGKYLPDGNIEFLGRSDQQVKIRGYRVELGEIQSKITNFSYIENAIVLDQKDTNNNHHLIAYIVTSKSARFNEIRLRDDLRKTLPDYMVPSHFIELSSIPLTANGKIDRKLLLQHKLSFQPQDNYIPPVTEIEKTVRDIWVKLLQIDKISRNANFFEIGGHSLLATQAAFLMSNYFSVEIPILLVFEQPVLSELAMSISVLTQHSQSKMDEVGEFIEEGEL